HLAEDSLVWEKPLLEDEAAKSLEGLVKSLDLQWSLNSERQTAYETSQINGAKVWRWLDATEQEEMRKALGFEPPDKAAQIGETPGEIMKGEMRPIEIHSVRPSPRT